jgi:uncharacterized protein YjiS (DUF1127 family)
MTQTSRRVQTQSRLARWWKNWVGNRAGRAELDRLDTRDVESIARDVGSSTDDLRALAGKWPDSADLLTRRLATLHLNPTEVARTEPVLSRDMSRLCSLCGEKRQCEHDLDRGAVDPRWRRYCPNSQTLMALIEGRQRPKKEAGKS